MKKLAACLACVATIVSVGCQRTRPVRMDDVRVDGEDVLTDTSADASPFNPLPIEDVMVRVRGDFCPEVEQKCLRWLDKDQSPTANFGIGPLRCAEFAPPKCLSIMRRVGDRVVPARRHMDFYIDKYEWPNKVDEFPLVTIDWYSAKAKCEGVGKRLCTADEWTFACEGPEMKPYPYGDGLHRDATVCNIDEPSMDPSLPRSEWPKHNLSVPSGVMARCVSPFGVNDMTGNVDEWTYDPTGNWDHAPYKSTLQGGYWGPVRTRCRPRTNVHGPSHSFYQQGFRCCADAKP